ncbi:OLC1v1001563C1 [Oldenlandia corymbosa var. corymbosa]|uniref:histidine kinase n=1 Tax=Oldenlandia corymbosa var. corymbosa TaxID=529605 RepID=A0AAV1D8Z4_OLDCO|nr:OLC1v1001563C1 [Oldenlandia corymbosa var. corymbosa]
MLTSILDTSRIEAGKTQLEEEEFDLQQLVEDVVDLYYPVGMAKEKFVDVVLDPCDGTATKCRHVKGDRGKLKQILLNLLSNAVKFTDEGHVSVRVWARKPCFENEILVSNRKKSIGCFSCLLIRIDDETYKELKATNSIQQDPNCMEFIFEVSDTGKGIPKEKHKMVFENYVQVKDTALGYEGTGLGLGIVQSLVRIMGGEISIVEKELGEKGTCFRFNTFFILCGSESGSDKRDDDREFGSYGGLLYNNFHPQQGPSTHTHGSKAERSHVVLFIPREERSHITKKFMESLGIKVSVVKQCEQLSETLKNIKQRLVLPRPNSTTTRSKELPLSAYDGGDVTSSSETTNSRSTSNFILVVIDTCAGISSEIRWAVAEFRKDLCNTCNRIVWIQRPDTSSGDFFGLKEDKLPPMDVIISKPLHGARLFQVVRLLPEFESLIPTRKIMEAHSCQMGNLLDESNSAKTHEKNEIVHENPLHGRRVLVVEDSAFLMTVATTVVSRLGAVIETCKNGKEALEAVRHKLKDGQKNGMSQLPFDYILMDCEMTEMDGYEATRRIREEEKKYDLHIPIIALTAHTASEEIEKMIGAGMDYYLSKPLKEVQLLNVLSCIQSR